MPIDAEPSSNGNLVISKGEDGQLYASVRVAHSVAWEEARKAGPLYVSHHATCPDGRKWSRKPGMERR